MHSEASEYLDEFIRELRRDGDATFLRNHAAPVLIVTEAAGEAQKDQGAETTVMAGMGGWRIQQVSLLNRVFAVSRGAFEKPGPIVLGRTDACDISIPDDSISKRHCVFEVRGGATTVMDCGSTNGTSVDGATLVANQPAALRGGEKLVTGNYAFAFHMPATFIAYLKRVVQL
jgi:hypothetical protein